MEDRIKLNTFVTEIEYINNNRYKEAIKKIICLLPDYFFEIPASSTGKHHPNFALGEKGLVRHTKVAVRLAKELFDDESICAVFTPNEKDIMIMALIVHDGLKSGLVKSKYTNFDHPILVSNFIKENKSVLNLEERELTFLCSLIESHMGPWNTNAYSDVILPKPISKHQKFVHMCDYLASKKFLDVKFDNDNII